MRRDSLQCLLPGFAEGISSLQARAVHLACARHEHFLPNGQRAGFFLGDGPGVGKGRQIAALVTENLLRKRGNCRVWPGRSASQRPSSASKQIQRAARMWHSTAWCPCVLPVTEMCTCTQGLKCFSVRRRPSGSQPLLTLRLMPPEISGTLAHTSEPSFGFLDSSVSLFRPVCFGGLNAGAFDLQCCSNG